MNRSILVGFILLLMIGCSTVPAVVDPVFRTVTADRTGLHFSNILESKGDFNMLRYMYFYNGAGVGAGDFNGDGLTDLFFAANQSSCRLFLNQGNLSFKDVTVEAGISNDGGWSTGVAIADVNQDGRLDIYVCRVGNYAHLQSKNLLLICTGVTDQGVPTYKEQAAVYGIDFSGFSTQASFFDYDLDGDLDLYLLNHSLRYNSTFLPRAQYATTKDSLSGDRFYINESGRFIDQSARVGINQSVIGYGLGIVVSDFNLDGWPDIYVGNDFHENDYLYINTQQGGFEEQLQTSIKHTSQFSMGVDAGDINNDGWPDIITADMLPSDPYILRRSLGEDEYNTFQIKLRHGYNYQYARNTLQLNSGQGYFREVGLFAGIAATDWSWSTLWLDFDNDGYRDLFVSNGIPKRLNDIDYVNYVSNEEIQAKIRAGNMDEKDMALIEKFPEIKLPNRFFHNQGQAQFTDWASRIEGNASTFSNGAVYADFDNDGDIDIVVNNIADPVLLYENLTVQRGGNKALRLQLKGSSLNPYAVGARVILYRKDTVHYFEKFATRGFQSSMETPLLIGPMDKAVDSCLIVWPDNRVEVVSDWEGKTCLVLNYRPTLSLFDYANLRKFSHARSKFFDVDTLSLRSHLSWQHIENDFNEFDREPLLPFMVSREGPAASVGDMNGDGRDDIFVGAAKWEKPALFLQKPNGRFEKTDQLALDMDSTFEDIDACWADINNDGHLDLLVASGGNEFYGITPYLTPRAYLNNGKGKLQRIEHAFPVLEMSASVICTIDVDGDGKEEIFLGGRVVPWEYGATPPSYIFSNDGNGKFTPLSSSRVPGLSHLGIVKDAKPCDLDADGDNDLLLAQEWGVVAALENKNGVLVYRELTSLKGWWNVLEVVDLDADGDLDIVVGNQGMNSRIKASITQPVRLYYADFDKNGKKDQLLTYYVQGKEIPFAPKADLEKQMPILKKKFLYADDFAKANIEDLFGGTALKNAKLLTATCLTHQIFYNQGNLNFVSAELPLPAQWGTIRSLQLLDWDQDGKIDILAGGNFSPNNIQIGRQDALSLLLLLNKGNQQFAAVLPKQDLEGEIRHILPLEVGKEKFSLLIRNNQSVLPVRIRLNR
ncbi:MAG: hypothetical protein RL316_249 [Bacteroidota bacterium]